MTPSLVRFDTPEGITVLDPAFIMGMREVTLTKTDPTKTINEQPVKRTAVLIWLRYSVSLTVFGTLDEVVAKLPHRVL